MKESVLYSNLNTLKEILMDDHSLVTYVSLSKNLCIHVNDSKSLLQKFIDDCKKYQSDLKFNVIYLISGCLNNNQVETILCCEEELIALKKRFEVIYFEHIYSISRNAPSVDTAAIMTTNKIEDLSLCIGLIKSKWCVKRPPEEVENLKLKNLLSVGKHDFINLQHTKGKQNVRNCKDDMDTGNDDVKENTYKVKDVELEPIQISSKKMTILKNGNKSHKGITGFFSKTNLVTVKNNKVKNENLKKEVDIVNTVCDNQNIKDDEIKTETQIHKESNDTSNIKTVNVMKKSTKVEKKRKRVLHVSDSESEEDNTNITANELVEEHESENEIPPTPLSNSVKIRSGIVNPKKKKRVVDKTYCSEDGFLCTEKEMVYENCSENEEETNPELQKKHNDNKLLHNDKTEDPLNTGNFSNCNGKKKVSPPQKGKQQTLMQFFKKK